MPVRVRLPNPLSVLDDRALLARFAEERDQPAFEQLVKRHGGLVYGVCKRAVRDGHLAEDAFQAVFLVLARHPRRAAEAASVGGWLFGVARRVGQAARRHELRREKRAGRAGVGSRGSPLFEAEGGSPQLEYDDLLRVLDEELSAMPEEPRAALVACFLEERTQDEAAHELGWSLSTLRRRLDRGKELLRARLARRGVTLALGLFGGAMAAPARAAVPPLSVTPSPTSSALAAEAIRRGLGAKLIASIGGVALAASGLAFGLSRDDEPPPPAPPVAKAAAPAALAPAPRAVEAKRRAHASGWIVYPKDRALPVPRLVPANQVKDVEVWKAFGPPAFEELLVHPDNRGLRNVVVWLRPDSDDRKVATPAEWLLPADREPVEHVVQFLRGHFTPRVLAVRAGDRILFANPLPVASNVFYAVTEPDHDGSRHFNVLLASGTTHRSKPLPAAGAPDLYRSSIYPWMRGCAWAFDHPYFAVTDADGKFEIPGAPAGKWRLVAWHETAGYLGSALGTKVTIPEGGKCELAPLTFESNNWPE